MVDDLIRLLPEGAHFVGPLAGANEGAAQLVALLVMGMAPGVFQLGLEQLECDLPIAVLGSLRADADLKACGPVSDADGAIGGVPVLAAGTAAAHGLDREVGG